MILFAFCKSMHKRKVCIKEIRKPKASCSRILFDTFLHNSSEPKVNNRKMDSSKTLLRDIVIERRFLDFERIGKQ